MKILFFDDFRLGVLKDDVVVDVMDAVKDVPQLGPHDLINGVIERWADYRNRIEQAAGRGRAIPLDKVTIRSPLPRPINIDCMAVNYMEDGTRKEPAPINAFLKSPNCVLANRRYDGAARCAGRPSLKARPSLRWSSASVARNIKDADAMSYVFGYTNFIDGSARGLKPPGNTFYQMKSRDTFAPIGPYIVTADEIKDPHKLQVRLWNNGTLKQNYNTSDMAHKIPRCIEFVSSIHGLEPGDVLATGTNHRGLHAFQNGDKIELEIDGLGRLRVDVRDDLKRTWPRDTRLEWTTKGGKGDFAPQATGRYASTG